MFLVMIGLEYKAVPWLPANNVHPAQAKPLPCQGPLAFGFT